MQAKLLEIHCRFLLLSHTVKASSFLFLCRIDLWKFKEKSTLYVTGNSYLYRNRKISLRTLVRLEKRVSETARPAYFSIRLSVYLVEMKF